MATSRPAFRQASAVARTSSCEPAEAGVSMACTSIGARAVSSSEYSDGERRAKPSRGGSGGGQPAARVGATAALGKGPAQLLHRFERMDRPELVDMRQHGTDAARLRGKTFEAKQRIEPDQPPARAVQPVHLGTELGALVALEPVGEEKDDRTLAE